MGERREGKTAEASVLIKIQMMPTEGKGMKSGGGGGCGGGAGGSPFLNQGVRGNWQRIHPE